MNRYHLAALALLAALVPSGSALAQAGSADHEIWSLLDDPNAPYVSLSEADFRALGDGFDLPDGGRAVTTLAEAAPGAPSTRGTWPGSRRRSSATGPTGSSSGTAATTSTGTLERCA